MVNQSKIHLLAVKAWFDDIEHILFHWIRKNTSKKCKSKGLKISIWRQAKIFNACCFKSLYLWDFDVLRNFLKKGRIIISVSVLSKGKSTHFEKLELLLLYLLLTKRFHLKLLYKLALKLSIQHVTCSFLTEIEKIQEDLNDQAAYLHILLQSWFEKTYHQ